MGVSIYRHGYNIFNPHDKNLINFTKERSFLTVRSVQLPDKKTNWQITTALLKNDNEAVITIFSSTIKAAIVYLEFSTPFIEICLYL